MTECIEREAAMSFPFANGQYDHDNANPYFINGCESYREWLEAIPAADVVPVVRCRDCKHRDPEDKKCDCGGLEHAHMFPVADDWFCADGERKDGDGDA